MIGILRIAYKLLINDRAKCAVLIVGITFAVFLMVQITSLFLGILQKSSSDVINIGAKVWVMDPVVNTVANNIPMPDYVKEGTMKEIFITFLVGTFLGAAVSWGSEKSAYGRGKGIYKNNCQICHGPNGKGDGPASGSFNPRPANFADPKFWQRKDVDKLFTDTIEKGHGMMPPISLKANEIREVIDYLSHTFSPGK